MDPGDILKETFFHFSFTFFYYCPQIPGTDWLVACGYPAPLIDPVQFFIDCSATYMMFFFRFLVRYYRYPGSTVSLHCAYVRQDALNQPAPHP